MGERTGALRASGVGEGIAPPREWPPLLDEPDNSADLGDESGASRREWPPRLGEVGEDHGVLGAGRPGPGSLSRIPLTMTFVFVTLCMALVLSAAAVYQVLEEHRLLGTWLSRPEPVPPSEIQDLRWDVGTRIAIRSTALIVLLLCTTATLWLQQRQLAVRRALHQVTLLARDILVSMDQGVITTDLCNVVTSINSAAMQILGVGPQCAGLPLERIGAGRIPLVALAGVVAEQGAPIWDRDFALGRGGRMRRIRADAHVLKDRKGRALGCVILLRDVSERVLMEERVRRMERFLSLGTLASGLHHEIKNPLTALSIHVQLLEKRLRDPAARKPLEELIGVVKSEVLRLNGVLESFRDFASLQRLSLQLADVVLLLEDVARLIAPQAAEQRVEVAVTCSGAGLSRVPLDIEKIKQAILNLVINGLEAMPEGGSLILSAAASDGELLIEVTDTGSGIPPEIQSSLFKPYFSTKAQGTGMGLALTEKLIGQHGGRIEFRTGLHGTTFTVTLPLEPAGGDKDSP